jgi:hypothetical protein
MQGKIKQDPGSGHTPRNAFSLSILGPPPKQKAADSRKMFCFFLNISKVLFSFNNSDANKINTFNMIFYESVLTKLPHFFYRKQNAVKRLAQNLHVNVHSCGSSSSSF